MNEPSARGIALAMVNVLLILALAPFFEGVLRKLKAALHSRQGPPLSQPYLDTLKLLGKEDLRTGRSTGYDALPSVALASVLLAATLIPIGGVAPFAFAGDAMGLLYVLSISTVLLILAAYGSGSPFAAVGGSREMMMLLSVEPVVAATLVVAAIKAGTLSVGGIQAALLNDGPSISMTLAAIALLLAVQAQAGKLPFDIAEADQEVMGGPLIEQSGPRLALFKYTIWVRQLVYSLLLVELFFPWPRGSSVLVNLPLALGKAAVVLVVVALIDVVNPRLRVEQAMSYYLRVGFSALAALAFAIGGM